VTRYGGGEQGLARARAATLTMLALPGAVYLYQGEELGLEEVDVAPEHRQDPAWFRTREPGRDGCRVPVPWSGAEPPFGFGPGEGQPWIPQPESWKTLTVEAQQDDPASTLTFYRAALEHRRQDATPAGQVVEILDQSQDVLAFRRGPLTVVLNCGAEPAELPSGEVLLSSGPLAEGLLPPDTAAWIA
jgi:alpha-glucosidase